MKGREEPYSIKTKTQETSYYIRSKGQSLRKTNRCPKCGKAHDILMLSEKTSVCFKCGKLGHFYRNCTQHSNAPELHISKAKKRIKGYGSIRLHEERVDATNVGRIMK